MDYSNIPEGLDELVRDVIVDPYSDLDSNDPGLGISGKEKVPLS